MKVDLNSIKCVDEFDIKAATLMIALINDVFDNEFKINRIKDFVDEYNGEALTPKRCKLIKYLDSEKAIKFKIENLVNYFCLNH